MLVAWLATAARAGCLDGTQADFGPALTGCVSKGQPPAIEVRRNGSARAFEVPTDADVLDPVGVADLDGDPTREWVLVQRCSTDGPCPGARTWIIDPDLAPDGGIVVFELPAGEVWVTDRMVFVATGDRAECTTIHRGGLRTCGTFTRSAP